MNEKINFINKVRLSTTSIRKYKDLIKENISQTIIYSILLSLVVGVILGAVSFTAIGTVQKTMENVISSDEFKFTLDNGILNFENSPITREEGRAMVYIDTNISLDDVESIRKIVVHKDLSFAILSDGISYRINGEEYNYKFSDFPLMSKMNNETLLKSLNLIGIAKYIAFLVAIITTYIKFILNTLILSIVGVILNKVNYLRLSYGEIFKICVYATTLPTILNLILPMGSFSILISGTYLIFVIKYMKKDIIA
ncbi:DUF1189 family protein [Clostridium nigeriense]|uniref:DUF1189 family protein n=1 Tax=Clostridium nigeriense TaxID=1805470 RepID=UPI003D347F39